MTSTEFTQFSRVVSEYQFVHQINLGLRYRRRADGIIVRFENIRRLQLCRLIYKFGIKKRLEFIGKELFLSRILKSFRIFMREKHERHIGISRNQLFKFENAFIDLRMLACRIVRFFAAEPYKIS